MHKSHTRAIRKFINCGVSKKAGKSSTRQPFCMMRCFYELAAAHNEYRYCEAIKNRYGLL